MRSTEIAKIQITILLLITVFLVFFPIPLVSSQSSTAVVVEPSTVSASLGESFDVTVRLSNVQNLYGLEIIVTWDPSVLRVAGVDTRLGVETFSDGVLHESDYSPPIFIAENNLTQTRGEYRLVATSMAPAPSFSGSGIIVRMTFEPIIHGDSKLDLESQLFDYPPEDRDPRESFPIEHTTLGSFVTVEEPTSTPSPAVTPTPTNTLNPMPTPTPSLTPEPSALSLGIEHVLVILAIITVIIIVILLILRRRNRLQ